MVRASAAAIDWVPGPDTFPVDYDKFQRAIESMKSKLTRVPLQKPSLSKRTDPMVDSKTAGRK